MAAKEKNPSKEMVRVISGKADAQLLAGQGTDLLQHPFKLLVLGAG